MNLKDIKGRQKKKKKEEVVCFLLVTDDRAHRQKQKKKSFCIGDIGAVVIEDNDLLTSLGFFFVPPSCTFIG